MSDDINTRVVQVRVEFQGGWCSAMAAVAQELPVQADFKALDKAIDAVKDALHNRFGGSA